MPISKIQLKGISRIPSDRLLEDGGCAESLNMQVNGAELSGVPVPINISANYHFQENRDFEILYEHRHGVSTDIICERAGMVIIWKEVENYYCNLSYAEDRVTLQSRASDSAGVFASAYHSVIGLFPPISKIEEISEKFSNWTQDIPLDLGLELDSYSEAVNFMNTFNNGLNAEFGQAFRTYGIREDYDVLFAYATGEHFVDITSIGNTLIVLTNLNTHYVLYKDSAYHYLGTKIPEPCVDIYSEAVGGIIPSRTINFSDISSAEQKLFGLSYESNYNAAYSMFYGAPGSVTIDDEDVPVTDTIVKMSGRVWSAINEMSHVTGFSRPILARAALRLYDNSYVYATAPILLGAGISDEYYRVNIRTIYGSRHATVSMRNFFTVKRGVKGNYSNWSDIVKSVDIFMSSEIDLTPSDSPIATCDTTNHHYHFKTKEISLEEEMLSKVSFHLIDSIEVSEITSSFPATYTTIDRTSMDLLLAKETLPYDYRSLNVPQPLNGVLDYNNRIIGIGVKETATRGYGGFQAKTGGFSQPQTTRTFKFKYYLNSDDGARHSSVARDFSNSISFVIDSTGSNRDAFGYIMYPDSRCDLVEVYVSTDNKVYQVPMKRHPGLDCSYAFSGDMTTTLYAYIRTFPYINTFSESDNPVIETPNAIIQSPANNPFKFDVEGWHAFGAKVIDAATTTKALSSGQFGQFPLYVFTEGGIEALSTGADGSFVSHSPVSRDVALPGTITPIDQAIVYVTKKGVMIMSGSDVKDISREIIDKPYAIEADARALLGATGSKWANLASTDALPSAPVSFLTFMASAKAIYDYINRRLIFFSTAEQGRQYVYALDSGSWHTLSLFNGKKIVRALNSYPEAHVQVNDGTYCRLYELGTTLVDGTRNLLGFIATRPIDFEQPDVYKTINRIRIRGSYPNERTISSVTSKTAQYLLYGSNDGINFTLLHSLRGPSWKYYRILIATDTYGFDRFSYIEVEWEPRFGDRIR